MLRRSTNQQTRQGATTVEMALCLPILFLVIFAIIEFARVNQIRQTVKQAAFEAARVAVTVDGTAAQAIAQANFILASNGVSGATVSLNPSTLTSTTTMVTVTVSANPAANGWFMRYVTAGQNISAAVTLESENVGISYYGS